jgi:hypothetical protein
MGGPGQKLNFRGLGMNLNIRRAAAIGTRLLIALVCLMVLGFTSAAQTNNATVIGTVTDPSGSAVAGSTVTATNVQTGIAKSYTSDEAGRYTILDLAPGFYDVQAAQQGFATVVRKHQELLVGTTVTIDFALQVSSVSQQIEVTSAVPLMQTSQSTVSRILETTELDTLPTLNRQFAQLAILTPGVSSSGASYGGTGALTSAAISIGNAPTNQTGYIVDGISNEAGNQGAIYTQMAQDWIQEFSVIAMQFPAEYGAAAGGVVNISTRSGTNQIHGRVYGFFQNDVFNADPEFYTLKTKAPFNSERGGVMAGGPIQKDKLFIFGGYERFHNVTTNVLTSLVNTADGGAFAATDQPVGTPAAALVPWLLYGPTTPSPVTSNSDLAILRLDYTPNSTNSFMLRGNLEYEYAANNGFGGGTTFGEAQTTFTPSYALNFGWTKTFSPETINELRFGFYSKKGHTSTNYEVGAGPYGGVVTNPYNYIDTATAFGGPTNIGNPTGDWAEVTYAGGAIVSGGAAALIGVENAETTGLITDSLTHTKGKHEIKVGGSVNRRTLFSNAGHSGGLTDGVIGFSAAAGPFDPLTPIPQTAGLNPALAVAPLSDQVNYGILSYNFPSWALGLFAQDSWKLNSNLTLNIGIRYDINNTNSALSSDSFPALAAARPGSHGFIQQGWHPVDNDPYDISPRLGFAWTPFRDNKNTVLRGGVGVFYDQNDTASQAVYIEANSEALFAYNIAANVPTLNPYCNANTTCAAGVPVADEIAVVDVLAAALANFTLPQFPTSTSACAPAACTATVGGNVYSIPALTVPYNPQGGELDMNQNFKTPGTLQATIGVQQQVTNSFNFSADFVYHRGFNGIVAINPNVALTGPPGSTSYTIVNPAYDNIRQLSTAAFLKAYQVDVQAHYRDHRGDSLQIAYQLGWSWDDDYDNFAISGHDVPSTNPFNLMTDYGPSSNDARNILNVTGYLNMHWGISLAPVFAYTSALPYSATSSLQAPGKVPTCPAYYGQCYPVGYSRDSLRGADFLSLSARLAKTFRIGESRSASVFLEGYNLANQHNLGTNFIANVDSASFGKPSGVAGAPRQMQIGGRFDF